MLQGWKVAGKAWTGLIGSVLTFVVPWVVSNAADFGEPWPAVVGVVVALLTALGIYNAPYEPAPGSAKSVGGNATPWPSD